ncbi:MAG: hypothetical protein AAFR39_12915 [Pseudomonadota bacterium]
MQQISIGVSYIVLTEEIGFGDEVPNSFINPLADQLIQLLNRIEDSGHLQIINTSDDGTKTEIEVQAPFSNFFTDWKVSWSDPREGTPKQADDGFSSDPLDSTRFLEVQVNIGARNANDFYNQAVSVADAIQDYNGLEGVGYGENQNSNSFVTSVMWTLGIDVPAFGDALLPTAVEQLPGLDTNVIKDGVTNTLVPDTAIDIVLTGDTNFDGTSGDTPNTDVFNGGLGDDQLFGGAGDDFLAGGGGADIIEGGEGDDIIDIGTGFHLIDQNDGSVQHQPDETPEQGDGAADIIIIGEGAGTDTILGRGDAEDRIVVRINDSIGFALKGALLPQPYTLEDNEVPDGAFTVIGGPNGTLEAWAMSELTFDDVFVRYEFGAIDQETGLRTLTIVVGFDEANEVIATIIIEDFMMGDFGIDLIKWDAIEDTYYDEDNDVFVEEIIFERPPNWFADLQEVITIPAVPDPYEPDYSGNEDDSLTVPVTPGDDQVDLNELDNGGGAWFIDALEGNDEVDGSSNDDVILGNDGDDNVEARNGNDWLDGGAGDDMLFGNQGDDILIGGLGNDTLNGGQGIDTVIYQDHDGVIVYMTNGGEAQEVAPGEFDTLINIENLIASNGNDVIFGNGKDNLILGLEGDDELRGRNGDDALFGDAGADRLVGGNGADYLAGGADADRLVGGEGADTFAFNVGDGRDVIVDFEAGTDKIALDESLLGGLTLEEFMDEANGNVSRLEGAIYASISAMGIS